MRILAILAAIGAVCGQQQVLNGNLPPKRERIAIIGAGAGGLALAYYLQKYTNHGFNITIFEKSDRIGGRTTTVHAYNDSRYPFELGGSVYVNANKIIVKAVEDFGLPGRNIKDKNNTAADRVGFWDGENVFFSIKSSWWSTAKVFWRFGISPARTAYHVKKFIAAFLETYYGKQFPFASLTRVGDISGLSQASSVSGLQFLHDLGVSDKYAGEIVQAITRLNYGLNLNEIHGVETLVSLAADDIYEVEGGLWQVFDRFVRNASATVHLETTVTKIERHHEEWVVWYGDRHQSSQTFDKVIIAAPYHQAHIKGVSLTLPEVQYRTVHVTHFAANSQLNGAYFNIGDQSEVPGTVLLTILPDSDGNYNFNQPFPFTTVDVRGYVEETGDHVYKIFSSAPIEDRLLEQILQPGAVVSWTHRKEWKAYPRLDPVETYVDFEVEKGLFYLNTMEQFISTLETSSLAGANVAALIAEGRNTSALVVP